jgi:hypothetical protein
MDEEDIVKLSEKEIEKIERVNQVVTAKLEAEAKLESQKESIESCLRELVWRLCRSLSMSFTWVQ